MLKTIITSETALQEKKSKGKWEQMEICIYAKEYRIPETVTIWGKYEDSYYLNHFKTELTV